MRQLIQISLLLIYLCFNAGLSYSMHYCGEQLDRINFFAEDQGCCMGGDEMPGCCDDVPKSELQNSEQQTANVLSVHFSAFLAVPTCFFFVDYLNAWINENDKESHAFRDGEAPPSGISLYIRHQLLLI